MAVGGLCRLRESRERPKGMKTVKRDQLIGIKLSEAERQRVDIAAEKEAISRSAFIRRATLRDLARNTRKQDGAS